MIFGSKTLAMIWYQSDTKLLVTKRKDSLRLFFSATVSREHEQIEEVKDDGERTQHDDVVWSDPNIFLDPVVIVPEAKIGKRKQALKQKI